MQKYVGMTMPKRIQTRCMQAWQYAKHGTFRNCHIRVPIFPSKLVAPYMQFTTDDDTSSRLVNVEYLRTIFLCIRLIKLYSSIAQHRHLQQWSTSNSSVDSTPRSEKVTAYMYVDQDHPVSAHGSAALTLAGHSRVAQIQQGGVAH